LPIRVEHATGAGLLPLELGDPFDRWLVAQAQALKVPILSRDRMPDRYDIRPIG
jgi:PIN domain nuclease of toxin-antitoxin system